MSARLAVVLWSMVAFPFCNQASHAGVSIDEIAKAVGAARGVVVVLGLPQDNPHFVTELAIAKEFTVYFQSNDPTQVATVRASAEKARILGKRVFVDLGSLGSIHLTHNIADSVIVDSYHVVQTKEDEILRVLRPEAKAFLGDRALVKPIPDGLDDWSHPYHGPDNNPQSTDRYVKGEFETQFIADPKFSPMPEQTVVAGGRMFKALGHIAHRINQNEMLNTLLCINAYNGVILWKRPLPEGFMIHRNTMVATHDALYLGDHQSCKVIDAATGDVRREITIPDEIHRWTGLEMDGDERRSPLRVGGKLGSQYRDGAFEQPRSWALALGDVGRP